MPTQIKEINYIPKWFDIAKYKGLATLDLDGWSTQISVRSYLYWMLTVHLPQCKSINESSGDGDFREARRRIEEWIKSITESPIVVREEVDDSPPSDSCDTFSVRAMSTYHVYWFWRDLSDDNWGEWEAVKEAGDASNVRKETKDQNELLNTTLDMFYKNNGYLQPEKVHAVINLSATDEQIISDFIQWLPLYRKVLGVKSKSKNLSEKDFNKWIEGGVIPFIDLKLWGLLHGFSFTQNILGQAIFPDETQIDTTERIRKTTSPKVDLILQENFSHALENQSIAKRRSQGKPLLQPVQLMDIP